VNFQLFLRLAGKNAKKNDKMGKIMRKMIETLENDVQNLQFKSLMNFTGFSGVCTHRTKFANKNWSKS
jgi:hypothetical protein